MTFQHDIRHHNFTEKADALTAGDLSVTLHAAITMRPVVGEIYFLAQGVGHNWYTQLVRPQFLSAVRGVVVQYTMVTLPERSRQGRGVDGPSRPSPHRYRWDQRLTRLLDRNFQWNAGGPS